MSSASRYSLRVTAGDIYTTHTPVEVNSNTPLQISTSTADIALLVRIKDFRPPSASSASQNHPLFSHASRSSARFSICFAMTPKKDICGNTLLLGNDFDEPIRELLPPFFGTALQVVKQVVDPGIDGDPYGEKPYLFGPLLSSVNVMRIANVANKFDGKDDEVLEEGADGSEAEALREKAGMPGKAGPRQKWFLDEKRRKDFTFEKEKRYEFDFFNGYLDFNEFALKLPMGISFNVLQYIGDYKIPPLRYVLKDLETGTVLFHVTFTLIHDKEEIHSDKGESNIRDDDDVD